MEVARGVSATPPVWGKEPTIMTMRTLRWLTIALGALAASGCGVIPAYTRANEAITPGCPQTRASMRAIEDDMFVGIAMSGGGSRAAKFSAAVLLELEDLGFLRTASALSSVSGSSLTAAYYGLFGHDGQKWNRDALKASLLTDFQTQWLIRWFAPQHVVRYWLTDFDRSDIMKGVFDDFLFEGKDFAALGPAAPRGGPSTPRILINATTRTHGERFVFADEYFNRLGSCLASYPVSHAVMASGAFPGFFQNVTLENYRHPQEPGEQRRYFEHLYDGGAADNLGVETLGEAVQTSLRESGGRTPRKCFFFIVDAYTTSENPALEKERDTRKAIDYLVDTNALAAVDTLLSDRRLDVLWEIGRAHV
jgi:NTE family protein